MTCSLSSDGCQKSSGFPNENGQRNILVISHWSLGVSKSNDE
jgi:hypothetical protein